MNPHLRPMATGAAGLLLAWALLLGGALSAAANAADEAAKRATAKEAPAGGAISADDKAAFDAAGLKIVGTNLTLAGESELAKLFADIAKKKKALIGAERELRSVEAEVEGFKEQLAALKNSHMELSSQLAQVRAGDTITNNRLVGAANTVCGQINQTQDQQIAALDRLKAAMTAARDARETYVDLVLRMRALADGLSKKWTELAADPALAAAVESASAATGKKFKLAPSPAFIAAEKKLEALEHTVLSESIPLTSDHGSMMVSVTINGKHRHEMTVDSGANSVALPYAMAKEMGMEPKSSDPKITCVLADGSEIEGTRMKIDSVRVGKFTVDGVECVVFGREAVNASALLGMSFLGNFTFEIDKQKSELRMVKVDSGDTPTKKSGGKTKTGMAKKRKTDADQ